MSAFIRNLAFTTFLTLTATSGLCAEFTRAADFHKQIVYCRNLIYVKSGGAALKAQPNEQAQTIMQLHGGQYLCWVSEVEDRVAGWLFVKKVPLAIQLEQRSLSCKDIEGADCDKITDFPTKWLVDKPTGKDCELNFYQGELGGVIYLPVIASGVCASGWVKDEATGFLGD